MDPLDLNADLNALTDSALADTYDPAPGDAPVPVPAPPTPDAPPSELDQLLDEQDNWEPDLELLMKSKAQGEETSGSLDFLSLFGISSAEAATPGKQPANDEMAPLRKPKTKKADEEAKPQEQTALDELDNIGAATAKGPDESGTLDTAKAAGKDIAKGAVQAPRQVVGGAIDAVNNFVKLGDILQEAVPLPGMQLWDDKGNWNPELLTADEVTQRRKTENGNFLPTTDKPDTVTGGMIRSLAQFVTGFRMGGALLGKAGGPGSAAFFSRSTAQGLFSDLAAFDGHEERLSNLIQSFPKLANPVTEYLAADPKDGEIEGRLKNAVEGVIPNAVFSVLGKTLSSIKAARQVKAATGSATYTQAADALAENVRITGEVPASGAGDTFRLIGDSSPDAPLTNLKASEAATDLPVPGDVAAKGVANAKAPTLPKQPVGDTFINFARINSGDDIKAVLKDLAESQGQGIDAARRGVQSNAETVAKAAEKYDGVWQGLLERRPGELKFNAEEQLALRQMWTASGDKLLETARAAEASPTAENLLAFRKMLTIHDLVQKQALAVRTETARALQQWNIPAGVAGREKISAMQNILLQHGGADVTIDLARKFSGLAEEVARNPEAMGKVVAAAEKTAGATTIKAINEMWIGLGLLSGPKTHIRNMISNMGMMASSVSERAIAARAEGLIDDKTAVALGEASAQVAGIFGNVRKAWTDAAETFKTGNMKLGMSQLDIPPEMAMRSLDRNTLLGKTMYALSYAAQPVFRGLQASDQFFKTLNFEGEMSALAHRAAVQAAQNGDIAPDGVAKYAADFLANPPKNVVDDAMRVAAERTFTNDPGKLTKLVLKARNEFPALRFVVPFVNTPANVFRTAIEYSPLAPVLSKYKDAIARGGADAAIARTKLGMGTTAMLSFIDMSIEGKITGSGPPQGSAEYDALRRTGWKPYTVRIGDKWVSYRGVEPFSTIMGVGADIGDYVRYSENDPDNVESIKDMMAVGVFSVADNIMERSFLSGLSSLVGAVTDPERNGARWVDSFASSFVPRGLSEIRYATDTTVRDARTLMDQFKARIPYISMTVPERRDEWGRVSHMESGWGKAYDMMSPFYASPVNAEPIDVELIRQGFGAGGAQRSMRLDGVSVSLVNRADIHNRYLELRGQTKPGDLGAEGKKLREKYGDATMLEVLNGMVTGEHSLAREYMAGTDGEGGEKHRLIQKVVRAYGTAARKVLVKEYPEIRDKVETEREKRRDRAVSGDELIDGLVQ